MTQLGFVEARHLISRTGFGAEWEEIKRLERMPRDKAIDFLMSRRDTSLPAIPGFSHWRKMSALNKDMGRRRMVMRIAKGEGVKLQNWWLQHMLETQSPFLERMTLFWHNYFPSSIRKTKLPSLLVNQNRLLRKHALGNFSLLLHSIAKDPAMLVYLDGYKNTKDAVNENFARELLELFTLGRQHFSERDVQEAARAFTGWGIHPHSGQFFFDRKAHDTGIKTFLGKRGNFNGEQIINILLKHPGTAETVAEKLWGEFINSSRPHPAVVKQWAHILRSSNYNIAVLMQTILRGPQFWDPRNRGNLVKSPVELAVGTLRSLPYTLPRDNLAHTLVNLGQGLFEPQTVKGWEGGNEWISTQFLMRRISLLTNLTRGNLNTVRRKSGIELKLPDVGEAELQNWLLAVKPVKTAPAPVSDGKQRFVRFLVLDPAYQVT
uniref:PROBABLE SIGNAL PEPTIDE PROTEIN n=1 Tax=uncultured Thiotrichaceae bacterium TaxID=298394 RepID=A0A6S6UM54_9GAMM|nr:MAG: PROBABLE SIGNAL PEPTIDE PROTEIN [uncultured Thiotrichaceae bacterium]